MGITPWLGNSFHDWEFTPWLGNSFHDWGLTPGTGICSLAEVSPPVWGSHPWLGSHPSGRDATRAFATGDFTASGLVDDVSALSPQELLSIQGWLSFYNDNYEPVGKLVGRFYDENGAPTEALREAEAAIEEALKSQAESEQRKQQFPPCNSEWSSAKGTRFWCSTQSGGVSRAWAGVPRKLHRPGSRGSHCVCVRSTGPPWGHPPSSQHSDRGDLDNPHLQEYEGCPALAEQCVLPG
ncbi:neuferricin [Manacus vitellinus]|uniref:neuferricin n=1 Tax=Manacus vitellinus TaxID=328815 RepID=UPI00115E4705|nr:neuferricin [Manacus vitellinus]